MRPKPTPRQRAFWVALIVFTIFVFLWVPFYNRIEPSIAGIPFFYWFQFCWIIVGAIITGLAYRARI